MIKKQVLHRLFCFRTRSHTLDCQSLRTFLFFAFLWIEPHEFPPHKAFGSVHTLKSWKPLSFPSLFLQTSWTSHWSSWFWGISGSKYSSNTESDLTDLTNTRHTSWAPDKPHIPYDSSARTGNELTFPCNLLGTCTSHNPNQSCSSSACCSNPFQVISSMMPEPNPSTDTRC